MGFSRAQDYQARYSQLTQAIRECLYVEWLNMMYGSGPVVGLWRGSFPS